VIAQNHAKVKAKKYDEVNAHKKTAVVNTQKHAKINAEEKRLR
jgi:hypothetical protein